jgi:hypothetical protein
MHSRSWNRPNQRHKNVCFIHEHLKGVESCSGVCRFVPNAHNNHLQHFSAQSKAVTLWPDHICEIIIFDSCSTPTTTLYVEHCSAQLTSNRVLQPVGARCHIRRIDRQQHEAESRDACVGVLASRHVGHRPPCSCSSSGRCGQRMSTWLHTTRIGLLGQPVSRLAQSSGRYSE